MKGTKYQHAMFVQIVATVGLFFHYLTGAEWIAASTIALAVYAAANVAAGKKAE